MPFKSEAQRKWMYANHPEMAKKWEKHTKEKKLPKKLSKKHHEKTGSFINRLVSHLAASGSPSSFGPVVPLVYNPTNEQVAASTYFKKMIALLNAPNLSEADKRKVMGRLKDNFAYGVTDNPHKGIHHKSMLSRMLGGISIPRELEGE